jgi:hypothetical protein
LATTDDSVGSEESDGYEQDLDILKPLIPANWASGKSKFRRSLRDLKTDLESAVPRRPAWLTDELETMTNLALAVHRDMRRLKADTPSKAAAKIF